MPLIIDAPRKRVLLVVVCNALVLATDFTAKAVYDPEKEPNAEVCLLRFIWRVQTNSDTPLLSNLARKSLLKPRRQLPTNSTAKRLDETAEGGVSLSKDAELRANASSSLEEPGVETGERRDSITSMLILLLGEERLGLVKQTISNELSLFTHIKKFPKQIKNIDRYIQLYTICSYLSPIILCEIKKTSRDPGGFLSRIPTFPSSGKSVIARTSPLSVPWVLYGYEWNVISGTYGDVICGKVSGGSMSVLRHSQDSASFFFSTYRKFKPGKYTAFTLVSETNETNPEYKQLEPGKSIDICIKAFRSAESRDYFSIWMDENFNLRLLERETWLSNLGDAKQIKLTPTQVLIVPSPNQRKDPLETQPGKESLPICESYCEDSIFDPSIYESSYPWSILSNKFWSSFLVMEKFVGPSFSSLSSFLMLDYVLDWAELTTDNLHMWSVSLIQVAYLFFSVVMSFTFTGSLLYQHCDLHANNLIFLSDNWNLTEKNSYTAPLFNLSPKKIISDILSSTVEDIRIIDFTYLSHISDQKRSLKDFCSSYDDPFISDIENWQVFTYNFKRSVDYALFRHPNLPRASNSLSTLIKLLESDFKFNSTRPKYVYESKFWWKSWTFNNNTYNELYDSVMGVGHSFSEAVRQTESAIFQNANSTTPGPSTASLSERFPNPVPFEAYFREVFYVPYVILMLGTCIYQHEVKENGQMRYFLIATETLSHYLFMTSKSESRKPSFWVNKNQAYSNLLWNKCIESNSLFSKVVLSEEYPSRFYYRPCFTDNCTTKKGFTDRINNWIQQDSRDRDLFIQSLGKLAQLSTNRINFALSVIILNQIKYEVKYNELETPEMLIEVSAAFALSLSDKISDELYRDKSTIATPSFLDFCIKEYQNHSFLSISISAPNFDERLCSKINKAVFTRNL